MVDLDEEHLYVTQLEAIGVQLRSRDSMHRYFRPFPGQPRHVHLHVCNESSEWEREHLLFRDYLRHHPQAVVRYARAKREAVKRWGDDGWAYTDTKSEEILDILDRAESCAADGPWVDGDSIDGPSAMT